MKVAKNKAVSVEYTLTDKEGVVIDTSSGGDPLVYIQGTGSIIAGLENAMEGKKVGDSFNIVIDPKDGYGERDEKATQVLERKMFPKDAEIVEGVQFQARTDDGMQILTVTKVEKDKVTVDANHPLAGVTLHFAIKVVDVRDATKDELAHGHVHGPGCHH